MDISKLIDTREVRKRLGVSRQRVWQLVNKDHLLVPVYRLSGVTLFDPADVDAFRRARRKGGRPRKDSA